MINLLPPKEKKKLLARKIEKLIVIWGTIILVFLGSLGLVFGLVKSYIYRQVETEKSYLKQVQERHESSDIPQFKKIVEDYNEKFTELDKFYNNQVYFIDVLEKVLEFKSSVMYFDNISIRKKETDAGNRVTVIISGFSEEREKLTQFKEKLQQDKRFKEIQFSPLSWARPTDVDFHVTFKVIP